MLREMAKVAVTRDKRHVVIDAGLGDEGVGDLRPEGFLPQQTPCVSRALPIAVQDWKHGKSGDGVHHRLLREWITQHFGCDDRLHTDASPVEGHLDKLDVCAIVALKEGRKRAGVGRDHSRSCFISCQVIENFTLPRNASARFWALSERSLASAVRTVSLTPVPVYSCAASKSSLETSTVILRISPRPASMP